MPILSTLIVNLSKTEYIFWPWNWSEYSKDHPSKTAMKIMPRQSYNKMLKIEKMDTQIKNNFFHWFSSTCSFNTPNRPIRKTYNFNSLKCMPIAVWIIPMASQMIINKTCIELKQHFPIVQFNTHEYTIRRPETKKRSVAANRFLIFKQFAKTHSKQNRQKRSVSASFPLFWVWSAFR